MIITAVQKIFILKEMKHLLNMRYKTRYINQATDMNIYDKTILMCIEILKNRLELLKTDRGYGPPYSQWQGSKWGV